MKRSALAILVGLNVLLLGAIAWVWVTPSGTLRNMHWQSPEPVKLDLLSMLPALPGPGQADTSQIPSHAGSALVFGHPASAASPAAAEGRSSWNR